MKTGSLYKLKNYFWFLYPSKDAAAALVAQGVTAGEPEAVPVSLIANFSSWWSRKLGCKVGYIEPKSIFMLLEQSDDFYKLLSTDGELGWAYFDESQMNNVLEVKGNS